MHLLGINAYHGDASAAIIRDGELIAAAEEERFNRVKHWAGFPSEAIRFCLRQAGATVRDIDHVAISADPKANLKHKLLFVVKQRPSIRAILDRLRRQHKTVSIREKLAEAFGCHPNEFHGRIHHVEHHSAHIASAFFVSPFAEASVLSIDGMGDFVSCVAAEARGNGFRTLSKVYYPHSVGLLYNAITLYLGFPTYGDEYKVMGLAPYGQPEYIDIFRKMIYRTQAGCELNLDYFTHQDKGIAMVWDDGAPKVEGFHSPLLEAHLGPPRAPGSEIERRHQNIAASLQMVTEEVIFHLLRLLHRQAPSDNLCLVGGVAMNSVANGKITQETPFKHVYIPAGAADNGTSFGAAFDVWHRGLGMPRSFQMEHAYWGSEWSDAECLGAIEQAHVRSTRMEQAALISKAAQDLCEGKIVGWFQGRMELGARALGNRSLLADPRRADMRDTINLKIKFREKFRPFAPSILEEFVGDYFEISEPSPFMEKVFKIRAERRGQIPAVTHVDGTGRLQTVHRKTNPLYWELINAFYQRTKVPLVLNTSLNENEPIVNTPQQALSCFLRTRMDAMVLGGYYVERAPGTGPTASSAGRGGTNTSGGSSQGEDLA
jgi:carbamoyltransferase